MADHIEFVIIGLLWKAITYCIFDFDPFFDKSLEGENGLVAYDFCTLLLDFNHVSCF